MKLWDRIRNALQVLQGQALVVDNPRPLEWSGQFDNADDCTCSHPINPFLTPDEAEAVYETLENALHAVWPLLNASEKGGVMAARGLVWGALYSFTTDEDATDQKGIAWELAQLARGYLPEDQDVEQMPGVKLPEGVDRLQVPEDEGELRVPLEMGAFFDAVMQENYQGAANVSDSIRTRLGAVVYRGGEGSYPTLEDAEKTMTISFLGSCLASLATRYMEYEINGE